MGKKMQLRSRKRTLKKNSLILKKTIKQIKKFRKNLKIMKGKIVQLLIIGRSLMKGKTQEQVLMVEKEGTLIETLGRMILRRTFLKLKINLDLEQILFRSLFPAIVEIISMLS
jgi:hypothetical protein